MSLEHVMTSQQATDRRTAIDYIEPVLEVREAGMRYLDVLDGFANRIESGIVEGDLRSVSVAFWSAAYGLGLKCCGGMSMTERANQLGVRRATISKGAKKFVESNGLSPSFYMKDQAAGRSYCKARLNVVANGARRSV
jgi:hypothetical protein